MRMRKRGVTDKDEVFGILARCRVAHVGMFGDGHPYVVPVSFGMEVADGTARIYFHCGKRGIDTRYESVVGFGRCEEVFGDEKLRGLELLCEHCGYAGHSVDVCLGLGITSVYRVTLDEVTGKRTLPEYWKQVGTGTPYFGE